MPSVGEGGGACSDSGRGGVQRRTKIFFGGTNLPISLKTKRRCQGIWKTKLPFAHGQSEFLDPGRGGVRGWGTFVGYVFRTASFSSPSTSVATSTLW